MAVLKHRPRIALVAPRVVPLGREVELLATVESRAPVPIRSVELILTGRAVWLSDGEHAPKASGVDFYRSGVPLHEGGELPVGRLELPARVTLPATLPGTYRGQRIRVDYTAGVKVDIPWWPDTVGSFELQVAPTVTPFQDRPTIAYSSREGWDGSAADLELSLATSDLAPGAILEAAATFGHMNRHRYRRLDVELVAVESRRVPRRTIRRTVARWARDLDAVPADEPLPLRLPLPDDLVPAFEIGDFQVTWELRASAMVDRGRDPVTTMPVTVHPSPASELPARAPFAVGSERVAAVWRQIAADSGLVFSGERLTGCVMGARIAVWRELSRRRGPRLVAELDVPSIRVGLGFDGKPAQLTARDPRHQGMLQNRLAEPLRAAAAVSASDDQVRCMARGAGDRMPALRTFVSGVVVLAHAIHEVRDDLPAPRAFEADMLAWRKAAGELDARLERAGPALIGQHEGIDFEIAVLWTAAGEPEDLAISVRAPGPIDRRHHLRWDEPDPPPSDPAMGQLCDHARSLEIERPGVRIRVERAAGLERAAALLPRLANLVRALCAPRVGGAYR